jgi:hypothetical protein
MVAPAVKREAVAHLRQVYEMSEGPGKLSAPNTRMHNNASR